MIVLCRRPFRQAGRQDFRDRRVLDVSIQNCSVDLRAEGHHSTPPIDSMSNRCQIQGIRSDSVLNYAR